MSDQAPPWKQVPHLRDVSEISRKNKTPLLPYEYWLKPSGNVVRLVVMNTRNLKDAVDPHRYAAYVRNGSIRKGWIPWTYQEARAYTPGVVGQMSQAEWETWREEERLRRQAAHNKNSQKYSNAWKTQDEAAALQTQKAMVAALEGFRESINKIQEAPAAPAKKAPKAKPEPDSNG